MAYKYSARRLLSAPNDENFESFTRSPSPVRSSLAERLRRQKYDTSSLPCRHDRHRPNVRTSDSDLPSKISQASDDTSSYSPRSRNSDTQNYKKLYEDNVKENERLRTELSEAQRKISELQARLEKADENITRKQALDNEKRERRVLEQKLEDMEKEIQKSEGFEELRKANGHLKAENTALQRIVEKLGGSVHTDVEKILEDKKSKEKLSAIRGIKFKSESTPNFGNLGEKTNSRHENSSPPASPTVLSRSSSSSSLSVEEKPLEVRRESTASIQGSDLSSRSTRLRDEARSSSSTSSYSLRKDKGKLGSHSSSPGLSTRSASPRRPISSAYDTPLSSSYSSRFSTTRKDSTPSYSSSSYNSLPRASSTRRDYSSPSGSGTSYQRLGSSYRSSPTPFSSTGSSYTSTRSKSGYTPSGTSSKLSTLSKYTTNLSSSRRATKF